MLGPTLHDHAYPNWLLRYPRAIRLLHAWNLLVLLRNRAVRRALRQMLPALPPGGLVVDAGCGDGLHIFSTCRRFPHLRFWGVDKKQDHVDFCEKLASGQGYRSLHCRFFQKALEALDLNEKADLLLCVGILQYIGADSQVLENFHKSLKNNGSLLLYTPVNGRCVLPFYRYFFNALDHYEKRQDRKRVYVPEEISEKLTAAGFEVTNRRFTYGTLGIAGHELYSLLLMGMGNAGAWAWIFALGLAALLPLIVLLISLDDVLPKKNGNGLLLVAVKR